MEIIKAKDINITNWWSKETISERIKRVIHSSRFKSKRKWIIEFERENAYYMFFVGVDGELTYDIRFGSEYNSPEYFVKNDTYYLGKSEQCEEEHKVFKIKTKLGMFWANAPMGVYATIRKEKI